MAYGIGDRCAGGLQLDPSRGWLGLLRRGGFLCHARW